MPAVAKRNRTATSATPEKCRQRSGVTPSPPLRKSPRLCAQDSPSTLRKINAAVQSLSVSMSLCASPEKKESCETNVANRKSPRLSPQDRPCTPLKLNSVVKSLSASMSLCASLEKEDSCETNIEKSTWDPTDKEQLGAVKEALHVSTAPEIVRCREIEQNRILDLCKDCVKKEKAGSLYVCGCPGTGKTLSMDRVKDSLIMWAKEEDISPPDVFSINCTTLANTSDIFGKILEHYKPGAKANRSTSLKLLHKLYSQQQQPAAKMIIVIADELDYLITRDREVLHDLFMLTTFPFSRCIVLGIANAIDLADRFIPKLQSLSCKPMVITFRAYSKDQIIKILQERLKALPYTVFQPLALELCARKVAAASGDMRKALSVCRSAIEMLEAEIRDSFSSLDLLLLGKAGEQQELDGGNILRNKVNKMVRVDHVATALSKTFKSPLVDTIQSLPQHQQIILCSAVKLFRGSKKDTTVGELNKCYLDLCKSTSIPAVGILELSSMCRVLADQGIFKLGQAREDKLKRVALKADEADITFALQGIRFFRNFLQ